MLWKDIIVLFCVCVLCLYASVQGVYTWVWAAACWCQRSTLGDIHQEPPTSCFKIGSLGSGACHWGWSGWPMTSRHLLVSIPQLWLQTSATMPGFFHEYQGLNSGPRAYMASSLSADRSPRLFSIISVYLILWEMLNCPSECYKERAKVLAALSVSVLYFLHSNHLVFSFLFVFR